MTHRNRNAISMLELIISITIVGIVCAAAFPRLQASIEGQRIEASSRQFFTELQHCRSLAMRENRRIRITPSTGSFSYQIRRYSASGTLLSTETVNLSSEASPPATISSFSAPPNAYIDINHRGEVSNPSGDTTGLTAGSIAVIRFQSGSTLRTFQISPSLAPLP